MGDFAPVPDAPRVDGLSGGSGHSRRHVIIVCVLIYGVLLAVRARPGEVGASHG